MECGLYGFLLLRIRIKYTPSVSSFPTIPDQFVGDADVELTPESNNPTNANEEEEETKNGEVFGTLNYCGTVMMVRKST
ncbi:unnamed protein product [Cuscuta campestris]|uniref:Uncharacterized protein n=1 Tax=Cuscuta campestris TaxID=132261 RepID=A0A484N423_9ASTE|nr:unnamed protein product [Cuscuta campestris]